jgi:hypothetical protein
MTEGERVGAIFGGTLDGTIEFLGYGLYEGHFPIGDEVIGAAARMAREASAELIERGESPITNPRIRLDNGKTVWGVECWWGPEDEIKAILAKAANVVEVDIDEIRKNYTK